jgi:hypothetical protein
LLYANNKALSEVKLLIFFYHSNGETSVKFKNLPFLLNALTIEQFKGTASRDFRPAALSLKHPSGVMIKGLKPFQI